MVCSQKIMVLGQKQNLTPKMGVAYGHVTTFAISEIVMNLPATLMLGDETPAEQVQDLRDECSW